MKDLIEIAKDIGSDTLPFVSGVGGHLIAMTNLVGFLSEDELVRNDPRIFLPALRSQ